MKSIGQVLKEARVRKKYSQAKLEKETKIKKGFIEAIEKESWMTLPEFPVVSGFIKKIAQALGVGERKAIALLKRDYPPQKLAINPKPDIVNKFVWSPKLTFIIGVILVTIAIFSYLIFQYVSYKYPPHLIVDVPKEGAQVEVREIEVKGTTDPLATVKVNNQPVLVDEKGNFSVSIDIYEGTTEIVVSAKSRSGKETVIRRNIIPELGDK